MRKACHWKPIIDELHNRLTSWKSKTLSYGGRLTLLKSVLGALGIYYFSPFKAPKSVITYLEKLRQNFFWGGMPDCNKLSWIAWNKRKVVVGGGMKRRFLSQKGDSGNAAMEVESPSVVEETVEKEKLSHVSSYANVTGKPSGTKVNFRTLFTLGRGGNGIDVVVPVESIRAISERFVNTDYGYFLGKRVAYPVVANYVRNTWCKYRLVRLMVSSSTSLFSFQFSSMEGLNAMLENGQAMIELRADVELKDNIVAAMPKFSREGYYTCNIRVEYVWKPPRCACCKVFGHVQEQCPKNTGTSETLNMKRTSQIQKGFPVGQKMGFKSKQVHQHVSKKATTNTSANKKKNMDPPKEVTNPIEVLTSVENDEKLGTNMGASNLASKATNSSGSSFWNVESSSPSTTPTIKKINKFTNLVIDGQAILVDEAGNPLKTVETGFDTQNLLEQWMDSYGNDDYDIDAYDDDMYEAQHLFLECPIAADLWKGVRL
nr:reverse transcriptase domain, reverse transcriptase zinc-binding domain protein [Tanacetum cinerariifolium]